MSGWVGSEVQGKFGGAFREVENEASGLACQRGQIDRSMPVSSLNRSRQFFFA